MKTKQWKMQDQNSNFKVYVDNFAALMLVELVKYPYFIEMRSLLMLHIPVIYSVLSNGILEL